MFDALKDELRAARNAVLDMAGRYSERRIALSAMRVSRFGLIDEWMRANNAIFIHIPKAAGRSVQHTLGIPIHNIAHIPAEAYRRADPQFYARAYVFSIVRNPWDRLVSSFHYMHTSDHQYNNKVRDLDLRGNADFGVFLDRLRNPLFRHRMLTRMHFMPQAHYLCDADNRIIVDRVGRLENLPDSFAEVTEPLERSFTLESRNRRNNAHYRTYYPQDWQVELVGRMYAADCEAFGYGFENSPLDTMMIDRPRAHRESGPA